MSGFLRVTESTNPSANTSTVTAIFYVSKSSGTTTYGTLDNGTITINGSTNTFTGQSVSIANPTTNQEINRHSQTITHNADGSKSISVSANVYIGTGSSWTTGAASGTFTLTDFSRIPTTPTLTVTRPKSGTAVTGETINLSWTTATAPTGSPTSAIDWYEYRYSTDNATWTTYNLNNVNGLGTTTAATFGPTAPITVVPGTVYYFQVRAHASNSDGYGAWSTSKVAYAAPTISSAVVSGTSATITVAPPSATGGSAISNYTVQYSTDLITWGNAQTISSSANPLSTTYTGLTRGTTYYFRAYYTNAASVTSPYTSNSQITIAGYGNRWNGSSWVSMASAYRVTAVTGYTSTGTITKLYADSSDLGITSYYSSTANTVNVGDTVTVSGIPAPYAASNLVLQTVTVVANDNDGNGWYFTVNNAGNVTPGIVSTSGTYYIGVPNVTWTPVTVAKKYDAGSWTDL
jgi:hypothetical protein